MTALGWDDLPEADIEALAELDEFDLAALFDLDLLDDQAPEQDTSPLARYARPATRGPVHVDPQRKVIDLPTLDSWGSDAA
ncbi:hypothetical protein [Actinacidiphila glaucinigra]|uniref:hypothetical protein n=1 Tax=Actinacidiphila glaucinigra TaxID=235986 RepID=UPI0035DD7274